MFPKTNYFINWIEEYWNQLIDIVSFSTYSEVKQHYQNEIKHEINLSCLSENDGVLSVELNFVLLITEKWLYRQANVYEKEEVKQYRNHLEARTALINRYLFNKQDGFFYDFNAITNKRNEGYNSLHQFYAFWLGFSCDQVLAKKLLNTVDVHNPKAFVVFMGLRRLGLSKEANLIGKQIGYKVDNYSPRISTNTCPLLRWHSLFESLDLIKKAGFDTFDHSMEGVDEFFVSEKYIQNAKDLKEYADSIGLVCNQTHSIFPVYHKTLNIEGTNRRIEYTKRILEISKILGAKNCIVHPINDFNEQQNFQFFQKFLPLVEKLGINIATENMWNWSGDKASLAACSNHNNFKELLTLVNNSRFVACVDIGHAEMNGLETTAPKMIENLGNYVKCLHIHDNDLRFDRHNLPLSEKIDFDLVLDSLARINYQGDITFECDSYINNMPKELHLSCLKLMYGIGLYFKDELLIRRKAICLKK